MIRPEKFPNALYALHTVLVLARAMAYGERLGNEIGEVLDTAECLPRLLAELEDRTELFRRFLVHLATKNSDFQIAVDRFDCEIPLQW